MNFVSVREYEIFLPAKNAKDQRVVDLRESLLLFFGGITDTVYPHKGEWKSGAAKIIDEICVWRIVSEQGAVGDNKVAAAKKQLELLCAQNEIFVLRRSIERLEL